MIMIHTSDRPSRPSRASGSFFPCRYEILCRICTVQIQRRKTSLDLADYTAPAREQELDRTRSGNRSALKDLDRQAGSMICPMCAMIPPPPPPPSTPRQRPLFVWRPV
ncbi:unnamed protein product [Laminaria digitata]